MRLRAALQSVCQLFGAAAALGLTMSSCSSGPTRAPTTPSSESLTAGGIVAPPNVATTWSCLTAGHTGIFSSAVAGCGSPGIIVTKVYPAAALAAPGAPTSLSSSASGSTVILVWMAPASGDAPASYVIEAGSSSGASNLANFDTGSATTSLTATAVPAGTYFLRVRAKNAAGLSGASNEFVVVVGGGGPCAIVSGSPTGLAASVSGSTVTLTWSAPLGGCPPSSYIIEAGSTAGASNLANFSTSNTATSFSASGVGAGTYYVRLRAANAIGPSGPSNEVVVTVQPNASPDFRLTCQSSQITIDLNRTTSPCSVTSVNGFSGQVSLTCSGQPSGVPCIFDPSILTLSANASLTSNLVLDVAFTAAPGLYTLQAVGTSAGLARTTDLQLTITSTCAGFVEQPSYTGNCLTRPPGTVCFAFTDGYVWFINETLVAPAYDLGPCGGKAVRVLRGTRADYHHVLTTRLAKEGPSTR